MGFALSLLQEKEVYRSPVKESLKSMLAMGWSIDRTKEGEAMFQQRENEKMRKISQASQVSVIFIISIVTCLQCSYYNCEYCE